MKSKKSILHHIRMSTKRKKTKTPRKPTAFECSPDIYDKSEVQYNGLKNQGATCYLNAVLQCLFMTPKFKEAVKSYKVPADSGEENLLLQLQKLFRQMSKTQPQLKE
ncbi:ubiquitin carboxyl-terminal hydrolase 21-like [Puntigrus tetrazona]|uniref:ubiquitin carboxyl-terminal hydrolase 21-like n=1 Tax=Puntigrus tetrazona TaxID=1606681 RepID=UPI001C8A85F2|nr:ubiquitin carboxyl-terminal hydrolase 21-like [Puntigrus tetrazona]